MAEARLDAALAERGIARSRTHAARLITDGSVTVDGRTVIKPSARVGEDQVLALTAIDHYVSRAAHKLLAALDAFAVPVTGRSALDVGASTGGFTQVLLERGAASVVALDVATVGIEADYILLIKPQFEVGRTGVKEGIVHDPGLRADAISDVLWAAWDLGAPTAGLISSPILGAAGNHEYLVWFSTLSGSNPTEWRERVLALSRPSAT